MRLPFDLAWRPARGGRTRLKLGFNLGRLEPHLRMRDYEDACLCETEVRP